MAGNVQIEELTLTMALFHVYVVASSHTTEPLCTTPDARTMLLEVLLRLLIISVYDISRCLP